MLLIFCRYLEDQFELLECKIRIKKFELGDDEMLKLRNDQRSQGIIVQILHISFVSLYLLLVQGPLLESSRRRNGRCSRK